VGCIPSPSVLHFRSGPRLDLRTTHSIRGGGGGGASRDLQTINGATAQQISDSLEHVAIQIAAKQQTRAELSAEASDTDQDCTCHGGRNEALTLWVGRLVLTMWLATVYGVAFPVRANTC